MALSLIHISNQGGTTDISYVYIRPWQRPNIFAEGFLRVNPEPCAYKFREVLLGACTQEDLSEFIRIGRSPATERKRGAAWPVREAA